MQLDQLRRRDFITLLVGSGAALGRSRRLNTQFEFLKRGNGMLVSFTSPSKSTIWRRQPSFMKRCSTFAKRRFPPCLQARFRRHR
jgi:hypothetical protein